MQAPVPSAAAENRRAALLMVAAMAAFAAEDTFLKEAAGSMPPGQVLLINGLIGGGIFSLMALRRREKVFSTEAFKGMAFWRNLSEMIAAYTYLLALAVVPLALVSALLQATPLMITAGAALFLGETVGWRRWSSIIAGFIGVMIILAPWESGLDLAGISMIGCVIALALRDLVTRRMPDHIGTMSLSAWGVLSAAPAGVLLLWTMGDSLTLPDLREAMLMGGAIFFGILGYYAVVTSMRIGEVSHVAPFRYTRLVFAVILAMVFLGETLSRNIIIGSAIVIFSGIYMFSRTRKRNARLPETASPR